ncbi:MAG TPA: serpin family protein [Polyangiaceae bacterium]|jgi:serpin B|nr:serpin family protein [Polyangiaceae bacterium]
MRPTTGTCIAFPDAMRVFDRWTATSAASAVLGLGLVGSACSSNGASGAMPSSDDAGASGAPAGLAQANVARDPAASISATALTGAVTANNAFALDLYSRLDAANADTNFLTSPISASIALTMTYAGAASATATEMASALHFPSGGGTSIFDGQNALSQTLASRGPSAWMAEMQRTQADAAASDYALQIVNSVWGQSTYPWATPFLTVLGQSYGSGVYLEDFVHDADPARLAINAWVSQSTDDKIQNLLPDGSIDSATRLVLVNAIHLKFPWASPFDVSATSPASFTTEGGAMVLPNFMNQTAMFPYVDDGQAQIVGLPLSGGALAFVIALPHDGVSLGAYEASLTTGSAAVTLPADAQLVALSLPKVTFTSPTFSLATTLQAMGMVSAFDPTTADFTSMCTQTPDGKRLYVADVLQKAMVSMQETGVEAAAATAVVIAGMDGVAGPPPSPIPMVVNRPYLASIVDVPTGAILFLGHITDPTSAGSP